MKLSILITIVSTCFFVIGCAGPNPYGDNYAASEVQGIQEVYYGTIVNIKPVKINNNDENNFIGGIAGAAVGGILGSKIGGGKGSDIAAVGGALLGNYIGNEVTNNIGKEDGINITVKLDNSNKTIAIVQPIDPKVMFKVGQSVQVNNSGSNARVSLR